MIRKVLIANRGEIACRIARTCRSMGLRVATVHSEADRDSVHVREIGESILVGAAPARASYLNVEAILAAARATGADAIHPGIGFLSESPEFCEAVERAGLVFVGPRADTLRSFGDKWQAKAAARKAGVPVIPGSDRSYSEVSAVERQLREMRFPVVVKAAAGGGGRGVRILREAEGSRSVIESAMREAEASFGRPDLLVERLVERARHVEVQVAGDGHGNVVHLFERECSLQRKFQKVIEEAPAAGLDASVRRALTEDAVRLVASVDYRNVGTIEFLVTPEEYFFLECNPRLQVEHTVTEEVTGRDLVAIQLHIAGHEALPLDQGSVVVTGHAIQARVNAEQPDNKFAPSTGVIRVCDFPTGVRVETGVAAHSCVSPHYDSMIAKIIVHEATRGEALEGLASALQGTSILGVQTNLDFLSRLLMEPAVREARADNRFIDLDFAERYGAGKPPLELYAGAAALCIARDPWEMDSLWSPSSGLAAWRLSDGIDAPSRSPALRVSCAGDERRIAFGPASAGRAIPVSVDGEVFVVRASAIEGARFRLEVGGSVRTVRASISDDCVEIADARGTFRFLIAPWLSAVGDAGAVGGRVLAPLMGTVTKVNVKVGDKVTVDQVLVVLESMKMELSIAAPCDGVVLSVACASGQTVERHKLLVEVGASETGDVPPKQSSGEQNERPAEISSLPRRRAARRLSN